MKFLQIDPIGVWITTYASSTRPFHLRHEPDYLTMSTGFVECCSSVSFQHIRHIVLTGLFKPPHNPSYILGTRFDFNIKRSRYGDWQLFGIRIRLRFAQQFLLIHTKIGCANAMEWRFLNG